MQPSGGLLDRVNLLIIVVLALAVVGSAVGVLTYEDERLGTPFVVEWATASETTSLDPQSITGAGTVESTFSLNATNITTITVEVAIAAQGPRVQATPVLVELVRPDTNETIQQEASLPPGAATTLNIPLEVSLATVPQDETISAGSPEQAAANLAQRHGNTTGQGQWILRVTFAAGAPGPLDAEARTVSADVVVETYSANVRPQAPDVDR